MTIVLDARTATDHFPGIGRYVVNLARALAQIDPAGQLTLLQDPFATALRLQLPALPRLDCSASPFSLRQQWIVPARLHRTGARLYHSAYYLMPYSPGLPTVLTCYDLIPLRYPAYFSAAQRLVFRLAHWLAINTAQVVLTISESTKADLIQQFGLAPQKIVVTPLAADPHFCPPPQTAVAALRRKLGLPEQYVLYFGSNKPHKNLVRLIEAFGSLDRAETKLIIAGHWDERYPDAKQLTEKKGWPDRIRFIGPVAEADLPALYGGASVFVFPSLYEGFGLPPLEAMACGVPVACSNASSLPEVVGDAGLLLPPRDAHAWQAGLYNLLTDTDLRSDLRERGLGRARQFTWEQTARQTLEVYETVLRT